MWCPGGSVGQPLRRVSFGRAPGASGQGSRACFRAVAAGSGRVHRAGIATRTRIAVSRSNSALHLQARLAKLSAGLKAEESNRKIMNAVISLLFVVHPSTTTPSITRSNVLKLLSSSNSGSKAAMQCFCYQQRCGIAF